MPPTNGEARPVEPACADRKCPKCGAETEPFEIPAEGLPIEELQLCPACYLVTWHDQAGFHVRQGSPVKVGAGFAGEPDHSSYAHQKRPSFC